MTSDGQRRARLRHLVDEIVARDVVARIEAVEIQLHPPQLLVAVGLQGLLGLIGGAPLPLGGEVLGKAGIRRHGGAALYEAYIGKLLAR
ncbi:hypothetical protein ABID58_007002 [Bradyrhizobium sp. S3.2.6]|uniref:hypothetical protein n=1 Tax=Bradyrhizobium sp. S3.2.6 TaxID=3156428 RepID=UPI00339B06B6